MSSTVEPSDDTNLDASTDAEDTTADAVSDALAESDAGVASADEERYLRLAADFENFRRRKAQELADRGRYASEDAARALLPVLDNLLRAVEHASPTEPAELLLNGLELVVREFESALDRLGVTTIDALGQPFDPALHEALGGEDSEDVTVDTVSAELQRGYRLHDRVLRPSLVRVAHPAAGVTGA